jgi:hypothetical protein
MEGYKYHFPGDAVLTVSAWRADTFLNDSVHHHMSLLLVAAAQLHVPRGRIQHARNTACTSADTAVCGEHQLLCGSRSVLCAAITAAAAATAATATAAAAAAAAGVERAQLLLPLRQRGGHTGAGRQPQPRVQNLLGGGGELLQGAGAAGHCAILSIARRCRHRRHCHCGGCRRRCRGCRCQTPLLSLPPPSLLPPRCSACVTMC